MYHHTRLRLGQEPSGQSIESCLLTRKIPTANKVRKTNRQAYNIKGNLFSNSEFYSWTSLPSLSTVHSFTSANQVFICWCVCVCVRECVCVCAGTCMCVCVCVCVSICANICVRVHVCMCTHLRVSTVGHVDHWYTNMS